MGTQQYKTRNGKTYVYYVYYDNGERIDRYCGIDGKQSTTDNLRNMEIKELAKQREIISRRLAVLTKKHRRGGTVER